MEPESIFSSLISDKYLVFQSKFIFRHREVNINVILTKLFILNQLYDRF